jgi:glutamate N-acetyltransferase / amino-acid N-acetyltransferase
MKKAIEEYGSIQEYLEVLERRSVLPEGFMSSTSSISFFPEEKPSSKPYKMNLSLILADEPTELFGAVFTRNALPGMPVIVGRKRLEEETIRGFLINNKISNVCAKNGEENINLLLDKLSGISGCRAEQLIPSSTGIIGWQLPVPEMIDSFPALVKGLDKGPLLSVAQAIMTTDSFPKVRSADLGNGRIVAIAKGAGMIEPNLATMLCFILTDIKLEKNVLRSMLKNAANKSFNCISVDGDQSTSDSVFIVSSGKKICTDKNEFEKVLTGVCRNLAEDIVRNGEGTGHVMRIIVRGAANSNMASGTAKAVANSPLVKSAIYGNDPNIGRLVSAIGDYAGSNSIKINPDVMIIKIGGIKVFDSGIFLFNQDKEKILFDYLEDCRLDIPTGGYPAHNRTVDIEINLGNGHGEAEVFASDLSHDYITINAEYRT